MSRSSGTEIFEQLIEALLNAEVSNSQREEIYEHMIDVFETFDYDSLQDLKDIDKSFDKVWNKLYPDEE